MKFFCFFLFTKRRHSHLQSGFPRIRFSGSHLSGAMSIQDAKAIVAPTNRIASIIANVVIATDWHPVGHVR